MRVAGACNDRPAPPVMASKISAASSDPADKYVVSQLSGGFSSVRSSITSADGVTAEGTAMIACSPQVRLVARGASPWLARLCLSPALPLCDFGLHPGMGPRGEVVLAPSLPGEVSILHLPGGTEWLLQRECFVACDCGVQVAPRRLHAPKGIAAVSATGSGRLVVSSYGHSMRFDLRAGDARKVESGHLMAWTAGMACLPDYRAGRGLGSCWPGRASTGAEVVVLHGPGTLYTQSRSLKKLAGAVKAWV